jgi:purine-nucleoside phosphorylase
MKSIIQEYLKNKGGNHMIPTPHIQAARTGEISEDILLPGDPLRARFIAETYFSDIVQFNSVRNALGYTGSYKGKKISVLGTGMGMPSIGIYSYELIHFYGVKNLIRVGSCGAFQEDLKLYDIIIGMSASTNSNYQKQYGLPGIYAPAASYRLLEKAAETAKKKGIPVRIGNILSSDIFYNNDADVWKKWAAMGVLAVEMEAAALYMNAAKAGADALCILTVSDSLVTHDQTTSEEREKAFTKMMEISLDMLVD